MDSNIQLNEDYKPNFSNFLNFFKDLFSESGKEEDKELNNDIEKIKKEQDNVHINGLEKDIESHEIIKRRKTTRNSTRNANTDNVVKENTELINTDNMVKENTELINKEKEDR